VFVAQSPEQFSHDADGNVTSDGRFTYTWDAENRLVGMETLTNLPVSVPRQKLLFGYDASFRRVSKVVSNWTGSSWTCASDHRFIYDGWNLLAEVGTTGSVVRSYVWGLDLSGSPTGAGGVGGLLWQTDHPSSSVSICGYDGNGNVVALLNAESGALSAVYEYGPFGETIRATGPAANGNPFRFSTKYTDTETGLVMYPYRSYLPSLGRWLSKDRIEEVGGLSLYGFVFNDPIDELDPFGLTNQPGDQGWDSFTRYVPALVPPPVLQAAPPPPPRTEVLRSSSRRSLTEDIAYHELSLGQFPVGDLRARICGNTTAVGVNAIALPAATAWAGAPLTAYAGDASLKAYIVFQNSKLAGYLIPAASAYHLCKCATDQRYAEETLSLGPAGAQSIFLAADDLYSVGRNFLAPRIAVVGRGDDVALFRGEPGYSVFLDMKNWPKPITKIVGNPLNYGWLELNRIRGSNFYVVTDPDAWANRLKELKWGTSKLNTLEIPWMDRRNVVPVSAWSPFPEPPVVYPTK